MGANIVFHRESGGISQTELARRSKVSLTTIHEIETKRFRDLRLSTLDSIARALKVPIDQLIRTSELDLNRQEEAQLLKASETILRITEKLRKND